MWSVGVRDNGWRARTLIVRWSKATSSHCTCHSYKSKDITFRLLSDEATGALDAESKPVVQDVLESVIKNQAIIVVAHCFVIAVEKGNHEILIDIPDEFYAYLVALHSSAST